MTVSEKAQSLKEACPVLAATELSLRNRALELMIDGLRASADKIFEENRKDLKDAEDNGLTSAVIKRLTFNESKLEGVIDGLKSLISLSDPLGKTLLHRSLDEGLELYRVSCPIGVIGIIFEARPDALVQISSLCIKSGNCAILKGGRETARSNRILFEVIENAVKASGLPGNILALCEDRSEIAELLTCENSVDLLIPRGSNAFVRYIMENTKIPVMGHADGICHIFADRSADIETAVKVITDAKTQYVSVCNAVETILFDASIADRLLDRLLPSLASHGVSLFADRNTCALIKKYCPGFTDLTEIADDDYKREYLDYKASIKAVGSLDEAITHINRFGSHHTDCIITDDVTACDRFMQLVDSANVYQNCSTRFADGFRYGFGAEVGIGTGKLHARGPVGLDGLVTYKYKLFGHGHIVADYAEGRKHFNFVELD